jgi:PilZ domain
LLMTSAEQNRIERRSGQRFPYQIPVVLRVPAEGRAGTGCTQDLSSRGALVWTDFPLTEGAVVEIVLVMPSEITLAEDMNVCCRAHVMRLERVEGSKRAVAVRIERYDFIHFQPSALQQHTHREEHVVRS